MPAPSTQELERLTHDRGALGQLARELLLRRLGGCPRCHPLEDETEGPGTIAGTCEWTAPEVVEASGVSSERLAAVSDRLEAQRPRIRLDGKGCDPRASTVEIGLQL